MVIICQFEESLVTLTTIVRTIRCRHPRKNSNIITPKDVEGCDKHSSLGGASVILDFFVVIIQLEKNTHWLLTRK